MDEDKKYGPCAPDCIERDTCEDTGQPGHMLCGHCDKCSLPVHHCGHELSSPEEFDGLDDAYLAWIPEDTRDYMFGE